MAWDAFFRSAVLTAAGNPAVRAFFEKYGMRLGVARFVAAEALEETLEAVLRLNRQGLMATLDYLGESVTDRALAVDAADQAILALRRIAERQLVSNVSVKLTQLGLAIDPAFCEAQLSRILDEAARTENFVRIDMEDSSVTQPTIDLFAKMLARYGTARVGLVLQSYLYRSEADRARLGALRANVRIVKGAYKEPKDVAFPHKKDVDDNYLRLVEAHMLQGAYTAVATHDERIVDKVIAFARERGIDRERFEFQMLYGISSSLQLRLARDGYRVRVYTPFGEAWYPYFTRRIAERPANLWFVAKGLFRS
ncbi:proline dehydrogenase family protein [Paenibacillus sp.]|uniref:proline dehydrogenase family protein n=1 Tax=Paenibacillus sp. TaxID=58172 RepID=UPI002D674A63|nr:proline dehydrogenase family protein [Paenibacillus sp.]HZG55766.1 proline dehydrogenase family protein [Paenibacillus sp.]